MKCSSISELRPQCDWVSFSLLRFYESFWSASICYKGHDFLVTLIYSFVLLSAVSRSTLRVIMLYSPRGQIIFILYTYSHFKWLRLKSLLSRLNETVKKRIKRQNTPNVFASLFSHYARGWAHLWLQWAKHFIFERYTLNWRMPSMHIYFWFNECRFVRWNRSGLKQHSSVLLDRHRYGGFVRIMWNSSTFDYATHGRWKQT